MRLVLRRNLAKQIEEEIQEAVREGRFVERVELTRPEMAELSKCPVIKNKEDPLGDRFHVADGEFFVLGVPVVLEGTVKRAERVHG